MKRDRKLMIRWMVALVLVLGGSDAWSQGLPAQAYDFSFDGVDGAGGYLVEVKDPSGHLVLSQRLTANQTSVSLALLPGPYLLRLTTLNKLGHGESSTDWTSIHVSAPGAPVLVSGDPVTLALGEPGTLVLRVKEAAPDVTVVLVGPEGTKTRASGHLSDDGTLRVELPALGSPGSYQVLVTNPPDSTLTILKKLQVRDKPPRVTMVDPPQLDASDSSRELTIQGVNFSPSASVTLRNVDDPSLAVPLTVGTHSPLRLQATVPPELAPGHWTVEVANSPEDAPASGGTLTTTAPPKPSGPKIGAIVAMKGGLQISVLTAGTLNILGQTVPVPAGASVPVTDVDPGLVTLVMTFADGTSDWKTVKVEAGETAQVSFQEILTARFPDIQVGVTTKWNPTWKLLGAGASVLLFHLTQYGSPSAPGFSVLLSSTPNENDSTYSLTVNWEGAHNPALVALVSKNGMLASQYQNLAMGGSDYWLLLDQSQHQLTLGQGTVPGVNVLLAFDRLDPSRDLRYFGFSGYGSTVRFSSLQVMPWEPTAP